MMIGRRWGRRGFTITEALVTLLVFSFFLAVLFMTMAHGFRTFSVAVARSDVTTEARRLVLFMEGELRTSAYFSIDPVSRKVNGQARDGVCFVSMLDWTRSDSFNALESRPNWDRYLVYYATTERPSGRLVRMAINPAKSTIPADIGSFPYPPFVDDPSRFMIEDPLTYSFYDLANSRVLASKVKSFSVTMIPTTQEVEVVPF